MTVYTLMFGWSLGTIGVGLITVAVTATSGDWSALATNALCWAYCRSRPVMGFIIWFIATSPPSSFIFSCGFFNAMLAAGAVVLVLVFCWSRPGLFLRPHQQRLSAVRAAFTCSGVGMLNGMVITALIGLRPDWLKTTTTKPISRIRCRHGNTCDPCHLNPPCIRRGI